MTTPAILIVALAELLGLDEGSIKQQVWPYLSSMKSSPEVSIYLRTLLGDGSEATRFINSYTSGRFPTTAPPPPSQMKQGNWTQKSSQLSAGQQIGVGGASGRGGNQKTSQARDLGRPVPQFGGGTAYVKTKEENYGGVTRKGLAVGSGSTPAPPPSSAPTPSASTPKTRVQGAEGETLDLSESGALALASIDQSIRLFSLPTCSKPCFCAARLHPISPYTPLCPLCALILCSLHPPLAPCPSCSHPTLLSPLTSASHISQLQTSRDEIISRESLRSIRDKSQAEAERKAIRFPQLADNVSAPITGPGIRGYAGRAGGGMGLERRIERAYEDGTSVHGVPFGKEREGKVLRLDMKTRKVKVVTKLVGKKKEEKGSAKKEVEVDVGEEDGEVRYVDEGDDGIRYRGKKVEEEKERDEERPFMNSTLEENRPVWIEEVEGEQAVMTVKEVEVERVRGIPGAKVPDKKEGGKKKGTRS